MNLLELIPIPIVRDSIQKVLDVFKYVKKEKVEKEVEEVFNKSDISSDDINKLLND